MSNLVAIAYDDVDSAQRVMGTVTELVWEHSLALDDAVIIERKQDGKIKLHQPSAAGAGAAGGAVWGGLIGLQSSLSNEQTALQEALDKGAPAQA